MGQFSHPNIISLLGVVTLGDPVSDITSESVYTTRCIDEDTSCIGNDYYGVDAEWRPEGEPDQYETNVRS